MSVEYNPSKRRHEVVLRLDPDEAENIAHALGSRDGAYSELLAAADRCRQLDEPATCDHGGTLTRRDKIGVPIVNFVARLVLTKEYQRVLRHATAVGIAVNRVAREGADRG